MGHLTEEHCVSMSNEGQKSTAPTVTATPQARKPSVRITEVDWGVCVEIGMYGAVAPSTPDNWARDSDYDSNYLCFFTALFVSPPFYWARGFL